MKHAACAIVAALALSACVSLPEGRKPHPADPFESWNRGVYNFNEKLDEAVLKPVAEGYRKVLPEPVRDGINNFFGNFDDAWSAINHFLQGKIQSGLEMGMRFGANTVFGLGGLFDPASEMGLERKQEDFGQTLGRWGFGAGPYIVLPLFGPSAVRETVAFPLDRGWSPNLLVERDVERVALSGLSIVDTRANLLGATRLLDDVALDKYSFVRDAWLSRRRSLVYDGDPPDTPADTDAASPGEPASAPAR